MLVNFQEALNSALSKVKQRDAPSSIALPARERRLPDKESGQLVLALGKGWREITLYSNEWKSGENGAEFNEIGQKYVPRGFFNESESAAIIQELSRPASRSCVKEYVAILATHKKYTGGDGFTFVLGDLTGELEGCSEIAIKISMDYFKFSDESPWFPSTHDIIEKVRREQKLIDGIKDVSDKSD